MKPLQRRRLFLLLPFVLFLGLGAVFYNSLGRDTTLTANGMVGQFFPEFQLSQLVFSDAPAEPTTSPLDRDGLMLALKTEQPWLVNVWASWCPQCYMEHGFIEALANAGAQVVGLDYKDSLNNGVAFLRKMGNPYQIVILDELGALGLDLGVSGAPETFLMSAQGLILVRHAGVLDRKVWQQKFAKIWQQETGQVLLQPLAKSQQLKQRQPNVEQE